MGTSGSGLNLCEPEDNYRSLKYEHYGTSEGLVNDVIQSILGDNNGNLWVATEYGISKLTRLIILLKIISFLPILWVMFIVRIVLVWE